jgi:hypothetical protein
MWPGSWILVGAIIVVQFQQDTVQTSPERVQELIEQLRSGSDIDRRAAVEKLGKMGPAAREVIPALEAMTDDPSLSKWARRRIGPGPMPFPHTIRLDEVPSDSTEYRRFQYVLHIEETQQDVPLAGLLDYEGGSGGFEGYKEGLDRDTLLVRWLEPNRLLQIQWETISIASGRNTAQGNVILLKREGIWSEILRDWRGKIYRSSSMDFSRTFLEFDWDQASQTLHARERMEIGQGWLTEPGPLADSWEDDEGRVHYVRAFCMETVWPARLEEDAFRFETGTRYFLLDRELADDDAPRPTIGEVAEFLADPWWGPDRSASDSLEYISAHNEGLTAEDRCPPRLAVSDGAPPFTPSPIELFRTGEVN